MAYRLIQMKALAGACLLLSIPFPLGAQTTPGAPRSAGKFRATVTRELALDYLLQLPEGYADAGQAGKRWPLLVFLHGAGERGTDVELVKKHGPPKRIEAGRAFPAIVVSPQCPEGSWWTEEPVLELIDHLESVHRVDPDRIYLTGLSMGGYGTWHFASKAPDRFAAIIPICGGGVPYFMRKLKHLPVWTFHGQLDTAVPIQETELLVEALRKAGNEGVKYTIYPELAHDSWTRAYETEELWEWLFARRRGGDSVP